MPALRHLVLDPGFLNRVQVLRRVEPFDGRNRAVQLTDLNRTRPHRLTPHMNRASPALRNTAAGRARRQMPGPVNVGLRTDHLVFMRYKY